MTTRSSALGQSSGHESFTVEADVWRLSNRSAELARCYLESYLAQKRSRPLEPTSFISD